MDSWQERLAALAASMGEVEDETQEISDEISEEPSENVESTQTQRLDVFLDKKGRHGKAATIVSGFAIGEEAVEKLGGELKKSLGTGGSVRATEILIQGDRCRDVLKFLTSRGFKARII